MALLYLDANLVLAGIARTSLSRQFEGLTKVAKGDGHVVATSEISPLEALSPLREWEYIQSELAAGKQISEVELRGRLMFFSETVMEAASTRLSNWLKANPSGANIQIVPLSSDILTICQKLAPLTAIHLEDLFHIATAVHCASIMYPGPGKFLSSDDRLIQTTKSDGLRRKVEEIYGISLRFFHVSKSTNITTLATELKK